MSESQNVLQTVDRSLRLLNCFTTVRPVWGVTDLARELGIAKSMVARLLETLEVHGFVEQDPSTRRYKLGLSLIRLGLVARSAGGDLVQLATPLLEELTRVTDETSLLCVPRDVHSVCIAQVTSPHQGLRLAIELGTTSPLYAGASNKALLAFMSPDQIERVIQVGLTAYTAVTVADPDLLRRQLAEYRRQGWVYTANELSSGVAAVGAPVYGTEGAVVASISIGGMPSRFTPERAPVLGMQVKAAADGLSRKLAGG